LNYIQNAVLAQINHAKPTLQTCNVKIREIFKVK